MAAMSSVSARLETKPPISAVTMTFGAAAAARFIQLGIRHTDEGMDRGSKGILGISSWPDVRDATERLEAL